MADHHTEYLKKTLAGLTPDGRARVNELLDELSASVGNEGLVAEFAATRKQEVASGTLAPWPDDGRWFSQHQLDELITGFTIIRDQERLDDVNDWANAVIQLLEDDADHPVG
jgi:hypothetical protein